MAALKRVTIYGPQFFEEIVAPSFGDLVEGRDVRTGFFGEFTVLNDVAHERKILDIRRMKNILKRKDASCVMEYDPIARAGLRRISVTELGGGVKFCEEEFYQGCLKDWEAGNGQLFVQRIEAYFRNAIATDLMSLMYFGDVSRAEASGADVFNTNKIDGIYTQYSKYVNDGTIAGSKTFNIPNAVISASNSVVYLDELYGKMDPLMLTIPRTDLAFYIDRAWADSYEAYLIATGNQTTSGANYTQDGITVRAYRGIPIFVNDYFNPVLNQIVAANAHFGVLTIRGNFIFATDQNYGTGPQHNEALVVWYSWDEDVWKWRMAMRAGTQIALPEQSALALPS